MKQLSSEPSCHSVEERIPGGSKQQLQSFSLPGSDFWIRGAVTLSVRQDGAATITLDVYGKESKLNTLSLAVMLDLESTFDQLAEMSQVTGLVILSGKADSFIAGANVKNIEELQKQVPAVAYEKTQYGKKVFAKLAALPFRTVAAINGICLGGGTELALACTYRVASEISATKFGFPEIMLGVIPGWEGCGRLTRLVGAEAALELILQPMKTWSAEQAWRKGLVSELVSADNLGARAMEIALGARPKLYKQPLKLCARRALLENKRVMTAALLLASALGGYMFGFLGGGLYGLIFSSLASVAASTAQLFAVVAAIMAACAGYLFPFGHIMLAREATAKVMKETSGNYPAPLAAIKAIMAALTMSEKRAAELESHLFAELCSGEVSRNLLRVFLLSQKSKKISPEIIPRKIAVLGCGTMGAGIVQVSALAGFEVVAYDPFPGAIERGRATVTELFDNLVEKKSLSRKEASHLLSRINFVADSMEALADCQMIIEAIKEDFASKQALYKDLEKLLAGKQVLIATNTSSLSVSKLAAGLADPSRFGGEHFFNPVPQMRFVEVISGKDTSRQSAEILQAFAGKLGKVTRVFKDSPLFAVNRILTPGLFEALRLLEQGVAAVDIEKAMSGFGFPKGPLTLMDEVGLDICIAVLKQMHASVGDRMAGIPLVDKLQRSGLLGKKNRKGFYLYDEKGKRQKINPDFESLIEAPPLKKSADEISQRIVLPMVNEAARCMQEGIAADADDINIAMILGTGWAPFRGGPLRYADALGLPSLVNRLELMFSATGNENYKPAPILYEMLQEGKTFCRD